MSKQRCKKCGKFVNDYSVYRDKDDRYCGNCAVKIIVATHSITEDEADRILTLRQVGNGHRW